MALWSIIISKLTKPSHHPLWLKTYLTLFNFYMFSFFYVFSTFVQVFMPMLCKGTEPNTKMQTFPLSLSFSLSTQNFCECTKIFEFSVSALYFLFPAFWCSLIRIFIPTFSHFGLTQTGFYCCSCPSYILWEMIKIHRDTHENFLPFENFYCFYGFTCTRNYKTIYNMSKFWERIKFLIIHSKSVVMWLFFRLKPPQKHHD